MALETADIFTIVYGSAYLIIVIYLSIYCWIKLEEELIFTIQRITVEYKKIASAINSPSIDIGNNSNSLSIGYHPTHSPTPSYQFSFQSTNSPLIAQRIQKHLSTCSYNSSFGGSMVMSHGSFLKPIPDVYYEKLYRISLFVV